MTAIAINNYLPNWNRISTWNRQVISSLKNISLTNLNPRTWDTQRILENIKVTSNKLADRISYWADRLSGVINVVVQAIFFYFHPNLAIYGFTAGLLFPKHVITLNDHLISLGHNSKPTLILLALFAIRAMPATMVVGTLFFSAKLATNLYYSGYQVRRQVNVQQPQQQQVAN